MAFQPGQSGNPGGRPKEWPEVRELAREFTKESVDRLAHWMRGDDPRASVAAAQALLDRGYGKPSQPIEGDLGGIVIQVVKYTGDPVSPAKD